LKDVFTHRIMCSYCFDNKTTRGYLKYFYSTPTGLVMKMDTGYKFEYTLTPTGLVMKMDTGYKFEYSLTPTGLVIKKIPIAISIIFQPLRGW